MLAESPKHLKYKNLKLKNNYIKYYPPNTKKHRYRKITLHPQPNRPTLNRSHGHCSKKLRNNSHIVSKQDAFTY